MWPQVGQKPPLEHACCTGSTAMGLTNVTQTQLAAMWMSVSVARAGLILTAIGVVVAVSGWEYCMMGHGGGHVWHGTLYLCDVGFV